MLSLSPYTGVRFKKPEEEEGEEKKYKMPTLGPKKKKEDTSKYKAASYEARKKGLTKVSFSLPKNYKGVGQTSSGKTSSK